MKVFIYVEELDNYGDAITALVAANSKEEAKELLGEWCANIDDIRTTEFTANVDKPQVINLYIDLINWYIDW